MQWNQTAAALWVSLFVPCSVGGTYCVVLNTLSVSLHLMNRLQASCSWTFRWFPLLSPIQPPSSILFISLPPSLLTTDFSPPWLECVLISLPHTCFVCPGMRLLNYRHHHDSPEGCDSWHYTVLLLHHNQWLFLRPSTPCPYPHFLLPQNVLNNSSWANNCSRFYIALKYLPF